MMISVQKILYKRIRIHATLEVTLVHIIWFALALVALVSEMARGIHSIDDFLVFRGVFNHVWQEKNLFNFYPAEYDSFNNYGPAFSLIIAPFALLPVYAGCFLWGIANAASLFVAIRMLPIKQEHQIIIFWITSIEMMTSMHNVQFNPMLASFIIFAFVYTHRGKDWIATLFIAAAILSKLYGVAGLVFFFFSKNKIQFVLSFFGWMIVLIVLPMAFSSADYIIKTYGEWYYQIIKRNRQNIDNSINAGMQDISVPGMIRRIFKYYDFSDLKLIAVAGILFVIPLIKNKLMHLVSFQLRYLALVLISIVIFSSAAESPTYVIAVSGAAIWFILRKHPVGFWVKSLLVLLFLLTILSPTDLLPFYFREHIVKAYSLKALPCLLIWCCLLYEVWQTKLSKLKPV